MKNDPKAQEQLLKKRQELEDSDASVNFSSSNSEPRKEPNTLDTKLKNLRAKEAMMGKNAQTIVRDKQGQVEDLKDSRQVKLAEIGKLNQRIVGITSWATSKEDICNLGNSDE